jgi:hypothetical protein
VRAHAEPAKRDEVESANPDESRSRREIGDIEGLIPMKLSADAVSIASGEQQGTISGISVLPFGC